MPGRPGRDRASRSRRTRPLLMALVATLAAATGVVGATTDVFARVEGVTIDARFAVRGLRPARGVAVVGIDTRTLTAHGIPRWPWPRRLQGRLLRDVSADHPRLIVYDVQVTEPTTPAQDLSLYHAVAAARPVVMVTAEVGPGGATRILGGNANLRRIGAVPAWDQFPVAADGEIRRMGGGFRGLPSVAIATARAAGRPVALAPGATAFIDFPGGPGTVPEIPAIAVLRHTAPAAALRGRIVVVGATAASIGDQHSVAAGGGTLMSGPELEADAVLTAIADFPLRPASAWLETVLIVLSAALVPAIALRRSATAASVAAVAWVIAGAVVAQVAFDDGAVVEVIAPLGALIVCVAGVNAVDLVTVRRDRARLEATFARYVPVAHARRIADLVESGRGLAEELEATVMFCDLRGWTGIAERTAPADLLSELNRYLGQVSDAVMDHGGSVVTFLGDGVMAVFGAPLPSDDHAARALAAGREILGAVGRERIGIGLATGPVVSGTVGSGRRLEYAAIGDTTNVAARVQTLTRTIGRSLLLTAATYERLPDSERARLESVGTHPVRGRAAPLELWSVS